ncbi:PadR family transcriptional regulator [Actinokineospora sp.]|uniref:PadR family transcriptional regulator n=1 Tax=Actinokineospora sp. TaxID=1872133 RepID=UPI004037F122
MSQPSPDGGYPAMPATAYAVLGLLSFGPEVTGYDLRKWAMNMRFFYWSPAQSQIYGELRRLREHGFVHEHTEPQPGRPDKRLYKITEAGVDAFRDWLDHAEVGPPALKHSVALRLFFGHQADPNRLRETLRDYVTWTKGQLAELTDLRGRLEPDLPYPAMVAAWGESYFKAEIAAAKAAIAGLDSHVGAGAPTLRARTASRRRSGRGPRRSP